MSLSELVANIGNECGYEVTSAVVDSSDVTTKQILALTNRVINEMADAYNWPKLIKQGTITLATSTSTYALPADFSHYHYETFWNSSDGWQLYGPLSQQDYSLRIGQGISSSVSREFQLRGVTDKELLIYPTPDSGVNGQTIIFQYTAARPVRPRTWAVGQTVVSGDYTFYNGIYYTASTSGTTAGAAPATDSGVTWAVYSGTYKTFLADTDETVLSQRVLEQGVLERFAALKQLNVQQLYLSQRSDEYAKTVQGKTLYAGGRREMGREQWAKDSVGYVNRFN